MSKIRTRFAPSPTGLLHMGGVRTALFSYLFALHSGGECMLRIEDTDTARSTNEFEKAIVDDLRWLGLFIKGMDSDIVRQSERLSVYRELAEKLRTEDKAYYCTCTKERLAELKKAQAARREPPRYDGRCRELQNKAEEGSVVRFKIPPSQDGNSDITFTDLVHGQMSFKQDDQSDFIIIASDKIASYNFAVVVDDAFMEINHVIRGDDHLSNTPRQILLQEALSLRTPLYAHLPLVLAPDKTPLSKRHSHLSVSALREEGYLPLALLNAVARLGWAPGNELMTLSKMTEAFDAARLSKSASLFNTDGLRGFARASMADTSNNELIKLLNDKFTDIDEKLLKSAIELLKPEAETTVELKRLIWNILSPPLPTGEAEEILFTDAAKKVLNALLPILKETSKFDKETWNNMVTELKQATSLKGKALFMPIRIALTGSTKGIELDKIISLIGTEEALRRLKKYI